MSFNKIMLIVIAVSFIFTVALQVLARSKAKKDIAAAKKRQNINKPVNKRKKTK